MSTLNWQGHIRSGQSCLSVLLCCFSLRVRPVCVVQAPCRLRKLPLSDSSTSSRFDSGIFKEAEWGVLNAHPLTMTQKMPESGCRKRVSPCQFRVYYKCMQRKMHICLCRTAYNGWGYSRRTGRGFFCRKFWKSKGIFIHRRYYRLQRISAFECWKLYLFQSLSANVPNHIWRSWWARFAASLLPPWNVWFFYHNGKGHPNCLDNINSSLGENRAIIHPVNLFMYSRINSDGSISVERPLSKAGNKIILKAEMNVRLGIAACSVSESRCNGGKCTPVKITVGDPLTQA